MRMSQELKLVDIDKLIPYANNARTHSDEQIEQIQLSIREFGFVNPILVDRDFNIIAGHGRLLAAKAEGLSKIPCVPVEHLTEAQRKAYMIADNRLAEKAGWDMDILRVELDELRGMDFNIELTGFDISDFEDLLEQERDENKEDAQKVTAPEEEFFLEKEIIDELQAASKVYIMFSGGRDSSVCSFLMIPILKKMGKDFELLFVDTGVEMPSVSEYVVRYAEHFGAKLTVVRNGPDFFSHYESKKMWPNAIYRDCIGVLIKTPAEKYISTQISDGETYMVIRGARGNQATDRSQGQKMYSNKGTGIKGDVLHLNPLYNLTQEAFDGYEKQLSEAFGIWEGYAKGFRRTACWCCPFQTVDQYDTIRKELPFLWDILRRKSDEWEFMGATHIDRYIRTRGL